ncbi:cytochrome P450 2U1-like [Branchiostoma floridae x Branchiostoma belcheri]
MGTQDVVVLNGYAAIKEAFVDHKDAFSDRPNVFTMDFLSGYGKDIIFSKLNQGYKEKRKFAYSALRTLGMRMGPGSIEEHVRDEARQLCLKLSEEDGSSPRDVTENLSVSVANVICSMVFGKRYDYDDVRFVELMHVVMTLVANISANQPVAVFPFLRFVPGVNSSYKILDELNKRVIAVLQEEIERHRETLSDRENPRDFIDLILTELQTQEKTVDGFTEENVVWILQDLFLAGIETTTTTLRWALLHMVLHPEEQKKVQAELDSVLGPEPAVPSLAHRSRLPYTEATVMEVQRIRPTVPLTVPHAAVQDTTFRGYHIPAGTQIIANLWSTLTDPEFWPDPERFDPRRFLGPDGKVVSRPESFMPFSTGRRVCLGEQLAKMELFVIFSSLLKHFTFKLPEGAAAPSTDSSGVGVTLQPPIVKLCITPR